MPCDVQKPCEFIHLEDGAGQAVQLLAYGARIVSLHAPDRKGHAANVVAGWSEPEAYAHDPAYLGCTVGRYANRIRGGRFDLDGEAFQTSVNVGGHTLHGGAEGFDRRAWEPEIDTANEAVTFRLVSPDGDQGFPGEVSVAVRYAWIKPGCLQIESTATTTLATPFNITNHAYFNLSGDFSQPILDHELRINADSFLPIDETLIPIGPMQSVEGTPFDFRERRRVGDRIDAPDEQLIRAGGYDHNWVLARAPGALRLAAELFHAASGRQLTIHTTEPGIQFYSGNFLDGQQTDSSGRRFAHRTGLCLETHHWPDSPNRPDYPDAILRPGHTFRSTTTLTFSNR